MKQTEVRFCERAAPGDKQEECQETVKALMSSSDKKQIQGYLETLVDITGKDAEEVAKILYKSCPLCPEEE